MYTNKLTFKAATAGGIQAQLYLHCVDRVNGIYQVTVYGYQVREFAAKSRADAMTILRMAFKRHESSAWVAALRFDGNLEPNEISRVDFSAAVRHVIEGV